MDLYLAVDSYFEYFLTVLGWIISNNIWSLIVETGLYIVPFFAIIVGTFLKAREQGDDEGNKGRLLTAWLENKIYSGIAVLFMCCVPIYNVSFTTLKFDTERMKECKTTSIAPEQTGLSGLKSELSGQTARLPLWWAFTYAVSKGVTHGAIASIPCKPDLRQIRFEVQNTQIRDPLLRREVSNFVQECFIPARTNFKNWAMGSAISIDNASAQDLGWIGSEILRNKDGLYNILYAKTPNPYFPFDPVRDSGRASASGGGYPLCKDWWEDSEVGLRGRLLNQIEPSTWTKIKGVFQSQRNYEDSVLKGLLAVQDIKTKDKGVGYDSLRGINIEGGGASMSNLWNAGAGAVGKVIGNALTGPAFDVLKQSLPYVQSLILFVLSVCMPLILVVSGYNLKAVTAMTFGWFSVFFLSFIWEIAYWLDSSIYSALYGDSVIDSLNNMDEGFTLNLVLNTMYIVMPALWIGFLGWAGIKAGAGLDSAINSGTKNAQQSTQQSINKIK